MSYPQNRSIWKVQQFPVDSHRMALGRGITSTSPSARFRKTTSSVSQSSESLIIGMCTRAGSLMVTSSSCLMKMTSEIHEMYLQCSAHVSLYENILFLFSCISCKQILKKFKVIRMQLVFDKGFTSKGFVIRVKHNRCSYTCTCLCPS